MRLCHIVPSLEERHGGPSRSVLALARAQAHQGAGVRLLTTAISSGPGSTAPDSADLVSSFPRIFPRALCRSPGLGQAVSDTDAECLHHHALWLLTLRYAAGAARRHGRPLVLSPRGMLSPWAYRHHHWRKRLAGLLLHPGALAGAAGWHATSPAEADDIRALGFRQPVCLAPNGVDLPAPAELAAARAAWLQAYPALADRRIALFYSRFHRKKRVRELLDLWSAQPRGDWLLLLAGVPEEYSVTELRAASSRHPDPSSIVVADSTGLPAPYPVAELFLLPSHAENFGLVVAEALAAGCPALVTDGTPWAALAEHGAGDCVPWPAFGETLARLLAQPGATLVALGANGRAWTAREFTWDQAAGRLLDFYRHLSP